MIKTHNIDLNLPSTPDYTGAGAEHARVLWQMLDRYEFPDQLELRVQDDSVDAYLASEGLDPLIRGTGLDVGFQARKPTPRAHHYDVSACLPLPHTRLEPDNSGVMVQAKYRLNRPEAFRSAKAVVHDLRLVTFGDSTHEADRESIKQLARAEYRGREPATYALRGLCKAFTQLNRGRLGPYMLYASACDEPSTPLE